MSIVQRDIQLVKAVEASLIRKAHLDIRGLPITVHARAGVVTLEGIVERLRDRQRAEEIARHVTGVLDLRSSLRVAPVIEKTDVEIAKAVRDALDADHSVDSTFIDVEVHDGVVTLRGLVGTRMQKRVVRATIWWLLGVQDVRDELAVMYPEVDSDGELEDACHIMLEKDPLVDAEEVSVLARDGVVALAGAVGSDEERDAAENTIWAVEGVREVLNHLVVARGFMPPDQREMGV